MNAEDIYDAFVASKEFLSVDISAGQISAGNIALFLLTAIRYVQQYKQLSGEQKKKLVLDLLRLLIERSDRIASRDKKVLYAIVDSSLPAMIEAVFTAHKGGLFSEPNLKKCFLLCQ